MNTATIKNLVPNTHFSHFASGHQARVVEMVQNSEDRLCADLEAFEEQEFNMILDDFWNEVKILKIEDRYIISIAEEVGVLPEELRNAYIEDSDIIDVIYPLRESQFLDSDLKTWNKHQIFLKSGVTATNRDISDELYNYIIPF